MNRLLALLLFLPSLCLAQLPDGVPTGGLVAWYSFNGNAEDQSGNGHHGVVSGASPSIDENDAPSGSYFFDGNARIDIDDHDDFDWVEMTILITYQDFDNPAAYPNGNSNMVSKVPGSGWGSGFGFGLGGDMAEFGRCMTTTSGNECLAWGENEYGEWRTVAYTHSIDSVKVYFDAFLVYSEEASGGFINNDLPITIGMRGNGWHEFIGSISRLAFWNRALTEAEIQALLLGEAPEYGCTDTNACNYDETADADDGSCEYGCLYCGEGTVWDSTLQECVGVVPPADSILVLIPSCGEGTVWDPVNEECIIAIPADLNYDGCVTVNDLLVLLAVHGTCPPYPEWPDEPADTTWTCGEPVTYWDYDYATVLIGDQCWFAENLRTATYANGDSIPAGMTDAEWISTTAGATAVYGEGNSNCTEASPVMDPCDEGASLAAFGRLYNWFAADDSRNICPTHWHVPTDSDWMDLEVSTGMDSVDANNTGWRGTDEGLKLKSSIGWNNGGNGQDALGFNVQPAGGRHPLEGRFLAAGEGGYFWTSTPDGTSAYIRRFKSDYSQIDRWPYHLRNGYSVRCVKD